MFPVRRQNRPLNIEVHYHAPAIGTKEDVICSAIFVLLRSSISFSTTSKLNRVATS